MKSAELSYGMLIEVEDTLQTLILYIKIPPTCQDVYLFPSVIFLGDFELLKTLCILYNLKNMVREKWACKSFGRGYKKANCTFSG